MYGREESHHHDFTKINKRLVSIAIIFQKNCNLQCNNRQHTVREIAKTGYIKSCDMIRRGKTKTNHSGREGLKTSVFFFFFCREEGQPYCNTAFRQ